MEGIVSVGVSPSERPAQRSTLQQVENAARQFEGLLLHQLLKSAGSSDGGWLGTGEEDTAGLQALELAQEHFAAALSARGGLGLANMVIPQLAGEPKFAATEVKK